MADDVVGKIDLLSRDSLFHPRCTRSPLCAAFTFVDRSPFARYSHGSRVPAGQQAWCYLRQLASVPTTRISRRIARRSRSVLCQHRSYSRGQMT